MSPLFAVGGGGGDIVKEIPNSFENEKLKTMHALMYTSDFNFTVNGVETPILFLLMFEQQRLLLPFSPLRQSSMHKFVISTKNWMNFL